MSAKRASIAQVMMVIALAALNLCAFRATPLEMTLYPTFWVFLGIMDFVAFWKLIRRNSLWAFHYTFLIVFVVAYIVMANLVATERFHPLSLLVRWYQQLPWVKINTISIGWIEIADVWAACLLSFALALGMGFVAQQLERRRNWDIAAFFRGALAGLGIASLFSIAVHAAWGGAEPRSVLWIVRIVLGVCLALGGLLGLFRLKSGANVSPAIADRREDRLADHRPSKHISKGDPLDFPRPSPELTGWQDGEPGQVVAEPDRGC